MVSLNLDLYNNIDENYLGKINIPDNLSGSASSDISTIVILDNSGSMSSSIDIITNSFLPRLFTELNYKDNQSITFITFNNNSEIITHDFSELKNGIEFGAYGGTYMKTALGKLKYYLENINLNKNIRILAISDGELHDQKDTVTYSSEIVDIIKEKKLLVNSQAIRFFTSSCQPDTRGLSSCLQFSNVSNPELIDIYARKYKYKNYEILFKGDGFDNNIILSGENNSIKLEPWDDYGKEINLRKGENIFWIKKEIGDKLLNGDNILNINELNDDKNVSIKANFKEDISLNNYQNVISFKINFYMKKIKSIENFGFRKIY